MIHVHARTPDEQTMRSATIDEVPDLRRAGAMVWVDVDALEHDDIQRVAEIFALDARAIEDITDIEQLPKAEEMDGHLHVVLHSLSVDEDDRADTFEMDCQLGDNWLVTFHGEPSEGIRWLRRAVRAHPSVCESADVLLAELVEVTGRRYLPVVDEIEDQADAMTPRALDADPTVLTDVQALRRDLSAIRRVGRPSLEVARVLRSGTLPFIGPEATRRMGDSYDLFYALTEGFVVARTMLSDTLESYRGAVDEQQTRVNKLFTVYAAMMLPPTLLAGIYGMNFESMPGTGDNDGFWVLIAVMLVFVLIQYLIFARAGIVQGRVLRRAPRTLGRGLTSVAKAPAKMSAVLPPVRPVPTKRRTGDRQTAARRGGRPS